ncbi:MAG: leucine-rich repeat domain-containing protein, partial [Oligoflexales bacterium]|nr:leucine-rich repeat domain-containing protein [Oligoflexales bacterium]
MAKLNWLTKLNLSAPNLCNIESIENLLELEELSFRQTRILDLSPLGKLKKLKTLWLENANPLDLNPISELPKLKRLVLSGLPFDLSPLRQKGLEVVHLQNYSLPSPEAKQHALQIIPPFSESTHELVPVDQVTYISGIVEETEDVAVIAKPFYQMLMEKTINKDQLLTKLTKLSKGIEEVQKMKLLYTFIMNGFRMGHLGHSERNFFIEKSLETCANLVNSEEDTLLISDRYFSFNITAGYALSKTSSVDG